MFIGLDRLGPSISMPPPPPLPVKTPWPDVTVGFYHSAVVEALKAKGFTEIEASDFLKGLQRRGLLCSDPAQQVRPIRFPPLVIGGKSYLTGKPMFEAQNQAAVSGCCMATRQLNVANLVKRTSNRPHFKEPLAFSICTEGPYMKLWVHYPTSVDNVQIFNMNLMKFCNVALPETVKEFLVVVDKVMDWVAKGAGWQQVT
jgi:hypothetical protein